ncbi:MAG: MFS transporter, partial [Pseudomonadota bacterium]
AIALQPVFIVAVLCATIGYGVMNLLMTATPLAMHHNHMDLGDTAFVIQWHVVAMFAPSFVTGHLINYFGIRKILLAGALICGVCVATNLSGQSVWHFWFALILLGVGWNFLFVGGTTLLTDAYRVEEKSRTQAMNDFIVFSTVSVTALSSGTIQHHFGWITVNLSVLPFLVLVALCIIFMHSATRQGRAS